MQVDTSNIKPQEWERLRTGIALKTFTALMKRWVLLCATGCACVVAMHHYMCIINLSGAHHRQPRQPQCCSADLNSPCAARPSPLAQPNSQARFFEQAYVDVCACVHALVCLPCPCLCRYQTLTDAEEAKKLRDARRFAKGLFYHVRGSATRPYIVRDDFTPFFAAKDSADAAFAYFDKVGGRWCVCWRCAGALMLSTVCRW